MLDGLDDGKRSGFDQDCGFGLNIDDLNVRAIDDAGEGSFFFLLLGYDLDLFDGGSLGLNDLGG